MQITLGGVVIAEADVPNSVSLDAGTLKGTTLYNSDGRKILKITGNEESDITLDGDFREHDRGGTPLEKMAKLAALRRAATPVTFSYGTRAMQVTITDFTPQILLGNAVRYHLVLFVGTVGAPPPSATLSSQQQIDRHTRTLVAHAANVGPASSVAAQRVRDYLARQQ